METIITICARGGSKGVPGKNIKLLGGRPLIEYTAKQAIALAKELSADIVLSTDSAEIKSKVAPFSQIDTSYTRPESLSGSSVSKVQTIWHAVKDKEQRSGKQYETVIDLDVVAPLRTINELLECYNKLKENPKALNIFSVSHADKNPYFNMIEIDPNTGFGHIPCGDGKVISRQTAPAVYALNGSFYMYRRAFFAPEQITPFTEKTLHFLVEHECFDIDEPVDFEWLEFLYDKGRLSDYLDL